MQRSVRIGTAARWVTALAAATITLTACGPLQLGAAAIYGGNQRITTGKLAAEAASLNAGYQADQAVLQGVPAALRYPASDISRKSLTWMLRFAAEDRLAVREHITVTQADVQGAISSLTNIARQDDLTSLSELEVVYGIPPGLTQELGRYQAIYTKLMNKLGGQPSAPAAAQSAALAKIATKQCQVAKSMGIQVSPQYGAFYYSHFEVVATASTLAGPAGGLPLPTAPQFQPSC